MAIPPTPRDCADCGGAFTATTWNRVRCDTCRADRAREQQRKGEHLTERACEQCGQAYKPYKGDQRFCRRNRCRRDRQNELRRLDDSPPLTRRCRNKDCIERFVPVNDQHWFHESACRTSENQWSVEDILREEGALIPEATHLELAKRAFGQKNQALRRVTQLTSLRDYLTYEISSFYDEHPEFRYPKVPKPPKDTGKKGDREILVQLSDWQIGKWEEGFGVEATMKRIENIERAVFSIVQRQREAGYRVPRATLAWGGDMSEGCFIYRGQNVTGLDRTGNTHRLTTQLRTTAHRMGDFSSRVASYVDEVVNRVVGGNHGRTNGPNDYADHEDNFDVMCAWWARDYVRENADRIKWDISEDWWIGFDVMGHYVVSFHGDQWNGKFERLETLLPQWVTNGVFAGRPDLVLSHHRHTYEEKEIAGIPVFQNGTIDGGSKWYLKKYGKASRPAQRIIVMSEKYVPEAVWPIYFPNTVAVAA